MLFTIILLEMVSSQLYWTRLFTETLQQGDEYRSLTRTITINLLDFTLLLSARIHHCFRLIEEGMKGGRS